MSELVETLKYEIESLKQQNRKLYNRLKNTNRSKLRLKKTINNQQNLIKTLSSNNNLENTKITENIMNTVKNDENVAQTDFVWEDVDDLLTIEN